MVVSPTRFPVVGLNGCQNYVIMASPVPTTTYHLLHGRPRLTSYCGQCDAEKKELITDGPEMAGRDCVTRVDRLRKWQNPEPRQPTPSPSPTPTLSLHSEVKCTHHQPANWWSIQLACSSHENRSTRCFMNVDHTSCLLCRLPTIGSQPFLQRCPHYLLREVVKVQSSIG